MKFSTVAGAISGISSKRISPKFSTEMTATGRGACGAGGGITRAQARPSPGAIRVTSSEPQPGATAQPTQHHRDQYRKVRVMRCHLFPRHRGWFVISSCPNDPGQKSAGADVVASEPCKLDRQPLRL